MDSWLKVRRIVRRLSGFHCVFPRKTTGIRFLPGVFGAAQFVLPDVLEVPPISEHGNVGEIVELFGGPERLRTAVTELETLLYAA